MSNYRFSIVIRNGKIVWKVVWIDYYLRLNLPLKFPKILVLRLPQNASNVNIECARKSKQLYSLCHQLLGALIYLHFIILMLICFYLVMPAVNYAIYIFSPFWEQLQELWLYWSFTEEEKHCCSFYSKQGDRWQFEKAI